MATIYVRSTTGSNANNGSTWALAKLDLAGAAAIANPGDTVYVSQAHAESTAGAISVNFAGTLASPINVICGNDAAQPPTAVATTATVTVTGNNSIEIQTSGVAFFYGITFTTPNVGGNNAILFAGNGGGAAKLDTCSIVITASSGGALIEFGGSNTSSVALRNTTVKLGGSGQSLAVGGAFTWNGGSFLSGGVSPTTVFTQAAGGTSLIQNVDFTNITPTNIFSATNRSEQLVNCALPSATLASGALLYGNNQSAVTSTDASNSNSTFGFAAACGTIANELTIVRTGGASNGVTAVSRKIVTNANATWQQPLASPPIPVFNRITGANVTVTVYGVWGGGAVPNNDDIWLELGYFGSSSNSLGTINASNTKASILASNSPQSSDGSTWGGSTTPFKMSVTLSSPQPAQIGPIYVVVKAGKASATFYYDQKPVLS